MVSKKVAEQELAQECSDTILALQDYGFCRETTEEESGDENNNPNEIEAGQTATISAQKRRSSGGNRKSKDFCPTSLFSEINPAPNTIVKEIDTISFHATKSTKISTLQLTVAGQALEMKATKQEDESYTVIATIPSAITKNGKYRAELYGQSASSLCSRQQLYTLEVNSLASSGAPNAPQEGDSISTIEFSDIEGHWAQSFILRLSQRGIVNGYGDGRFGPDDNITRAELSKIALNTFAIGTRDSQSNPFPDVSISQWFTPFITQAKFFDIINGYADGTFRPNNPVTRGEGLKTLLAAAGIDTSEFSGESDFPDTQKDAFYTEYINWAVDKGIADGYENGNFGPNDILTRAQLSKIAVNLIDLLNR